MTIERDILEQTQLDLETQADHLGLDGVDRRAFVYLSLVAATAGTVGVRRAAAQPPPGGRGTAAGQAQAATPIPLGEPPSWTFQAYPGGNGAIIDKVMRERGAKAFERAAFTVEKWSGPVPTRDEEIAYLPAHRLSALIQERKLTSARLTNIYLERIKRLNPTLLCAVTIFEEQARAEAASADAEIAAGRYRGPLHGLPYGIKDLFSAKGAPTTWGSAEFEHRVIDEDAELIVRFREAGAILLAKLSTGQFAVNDTWFRGQTKNPWDTRRGSSGSSAGPGSATAAGCLAFSIGTETSGSIVSPARVNGIAALRPTFGRVTRHGAMVASYSSDRAGPMCRTIEDCAMVFNAVHGVDEKDPSTLMMPFHFDRNIKLSSVRIGVDPAAPKELVDQLRALGANLSPLGPRPSANLQIGGGGSSAFFDDFVRAKAKELGIEMSDLEERLRNAPPGGGPTAPTGIPGMPPFLGLRGRSNLALDLLQGMRRVHIVQRQMVELLKDLDLYVPPPAGDVGLHSVTGHPAAVVAYGFGVPAQGGGAGGRGGGRAAGRAGGRAGGRGGRPTSDSAPPAAPPNPQPICGVIAGNLFLDDTLLSVAHQLQVNSDWHTRHPTV